MSIRNADLAVAPAAGEPARGRPARPGARALRSLRADPARMAAVHASWRALWTSRLVVWIAGAGTVAAFGPGPLRRVLNPAGLTSSLGSVGEALAGPAARWDSAWYLVIAKYGYRPDLGQLTAPRQAYFPLYPLMVRGIGYSGLPLAAAGVVISLVAFALALYGIHRLTALELPGRPEAARLAVMATAFSPMALFFSAVYTDALYMALSVGLFWSARRGRWALVGLLGALAVATRSTGLALAVPALAIYLYGPRADRPPDRPRGGAAEFPGSGRLRRAGAALVPRYRLRPSVLWLALLPVGLVAWCLWLAASGGDALGPFHAEQAWARHFVGPYLGIWDGLVAGFDGLRQLLSGQTHHVYFTLVGGDPFVAAQHNLTNLAFLLLAIPMTIGVLRRLPAAYGLYVLAAMALPLSYPVEPEPLMSVPRYLVVLFPLWIWLGAWLQPRPHLRRVALAASILLLVLFTAQFATWHWVA